MSASHNTELVRRLRDETRREHEVIEAALEWERMASSRAVYAGWLQRLHRFHLGWEPAIERAIGDPAFLTPRRKLHLLEADLQTLGQAQHPVPEPLPVQPFASAAAAWGSLYVIEGSTLGGQLIARHVATELRFSPTYHGAYGANTGAMWRTFKQAIGRAVSPDDADVAIQSAAQTFRDFTQWLSAKSDAKSL